MLVSGRVPFRIHALLGSQGEKVSIHHSTSTLFDTVGNPRDRLIMIRKSEANTLANNKTENIYINIYKLYIVRYIINKNYMCVCMVRKKGVAINSHSKKKMWLRNPLGGFFLFKDRIVEPCLCSHQKRWKCTLDYAVETVETQNERIRSLKRDHVFQTFHRTQASIFRKCCWWKKSR